MSEGKIVARIRRTRGQGMRRSWIIWFAIALHLIYGTALLVEPGARTLSGIFGVERFVQSTGLTSALFVGSALAAAWGVLTFNHRSMWSIMMMMPQQVLLLLSAGTAMETIITGTFPSSGATMATMRAIPGFAPIVLSAAFHNLGILEAHIWRR